MPNNEEEVHSTEVSNINKEVHPMEVVHPIYNESSSEVSNIYKEVPPPPPTWPPPSFLRLKTKSSETSMKRTHDDEESEALLNEAEVIQDLEEAAMEELHRCQACSSEAVQNQPQEPVIQEQPKKKSG